MSKERDNRLVKQILKGQTEFYRKLVDRHAPMVFHIVNRFVDDPEEAEELAQEIFVKTYERLSSFKGKSKFSSWLFMIAMNHCRDYAKNVRRKNKSFSDLERRDLENRMKDQKTPDHKIEQEEWSYLLQKGLSTINNDYAEAFLMKYESGMTYQAMSERLDASVSALKVRVHRAKKELKKFIEQYH